MAVIPQLVARDQPDDGAYSISTIDLLIALIVLTCLATVSGIAFAVVKNRQRKALRAKLLLPLHHGQNSHLAAPAQPSHRRTGTLTSAPNSTTFVVSNGEKDFLLSDDEGEEFSEKRTSPVPQIHLHLPEELDEETGKRSSKVVVVTITEKGNVGLEPHVEEPAPPMYSEKDDEFMSLDLDRIGGLREKR